MDMDMIMKQDLDRDQYYKQHDVRHILDATLPQRSLLAKSCR